MDRESSSGESTIRMDNLLGDSEAQLAWATRWQISMRFVSRMRCDALRTVSVSVTSISLTTGRLSAASGGSHSDCHCRCARPGPARHMNARSRSPTGASRMVQLYMYLPPHSRFPLSPFNWAPRSSSLQNLPSYNPPTPFCDASDSTRAGSSRCLPLAHAIGRGALRLRLTFLPFCMNAYICRNVEG